MLAVIRLTLLSLFILAVSSAQTTQGLISGRVRNSVTGRPLAGLAIAWSSTTLGSSGIATSDAGGFYFLPLLSAGTYTVRASGADYQPQEVQQLELAVAGRIQLDFQLRPLNDVWESGQYRSVFLPGTKTIVTFYGPDLDSSRSGSFEAQRGQRGTLDTSASYVIDPNQIALLPLLGRDVYTMLVSLPAVAADSGTGRGLGISVAGQRPSSSNYLLDGVENNNYLVTGPLNPVAPEAVQEYRISTNNYSAEYGRTAGFIANAVTRAGGNGYHGVTYEYLKNEKLNAADFGDNLQGLGRRFLRENQFGFQAGGPIRRNRLYFSSALEQFISHSRKDPATYLLPTNIFISSLQLPTTRLARQLLEKYPAPPLPSTSLVDTLSIRQPVVVDRLIALERGDYTSPSGRDHLMGRLVLSRFTQPDFIWSPYPDFISPLHQNTIGAAVNWQHTWTPALTSELKLSYTDDNLWWDRSHPEVPTLLSASGESLPGSPAFYAYRNHNKSPEAIYSTVWTRNRHVISVGAGLLIRRNSGYLTAGRDGEYLFGNAIDFAQDRPYLFAASISRLSATAVQPDFNRNYSYSRSYFFAQDSFRVSARLTLNFGLRYEWFGSPSNTGGTKDVQVLLGAGSAFTTRLQNATLQLPGSGDEQIFGSDTGNWAPRLGFSWDPFGKSKTLIRGGYGIFYDRPFDNLWQNVRNNGLLLPFYSLDDSRPTNYLEPVSSAVKRYPSIGSSFPNLTLIDPKLRNGYSQTFFTGVQHEITENLNLEVNGSGALGRRLVTTDIVNREFTVAGSPAGRPNSALPDVSWRSGQGVSDYYALSALLRYRGRTFQVQAAYTWSHSIDNQSDALTGDFFDLNFSSINSRDSSRLLSAFTRQYDSAVDRGNSDFDQRHNVFLLGLWQTRSRFRVAQGWQLSGLAAFRTGTPYTVTGLTFDVPDGGGVFVNHRADLVNPSAAYLTNPVPASGGMYVLDASAFRSADRNTVGSAGRNAFRGPGLYNADLSLARSFSIPRLREGMRLTVRADAFNVLNHANLNNPDSQLGSPTFGLSSFGRQGASSGFPAVAPLNETARQIQMLLRLEF